VLVKKEIRLHIARQLNDRVACVGCRACCDSCDGCDGCDDKLLNPCILKSDHHPKSNLLQVRINGLGQLYPLHQCRVLL